MSSKGFVIFADGDDYVRQAYLCAMSIRATENEYPVSIITCNNVPKKYQWVFDKIIDIPWYKKTDTRFKTEHRWKVYHATPYEETIVLDSDLLVLQNLNYLWSLFANYDLYYPTRVFTYRKELITNNYYRKAFTTNNLPNIYNTLHYFKKCDTAKEFYKWIELISNNWELFYGNFCKEFYPKEPSMDVTCAIASKIMDIDTEITNARQDLPILVHMKSKIQGWLNPVSEWQSRVGIYLTDDLKLKIGNHLQDTIFHYTEKDFVTDGIIGKYEQCLIK